MFFVHCLKHCVTGKLTKVQTPPRYEYNTAWISVSGHRDFTFDVQACSDVYLALSHIPSNYRTLTYEIVIGASGNTKTAIRTKVNGTNVYETPTPNILNCNQAMSFWITWSKGRIKVGKGTVRGMYMCTYILLFVGKKI